MSLKCVISHDWSSWEYEDTGSCIQVRHCKREKCNEQDSRRVHTWTDWAYAAENSCVSIRTCSRCGKQVTKEEEHNWDIWRFEAPDSCAQVRFCRRCDYRQERRPSKHNWTQWKYKFDDSCEIQVRWCRRCSQEENIGGDRGDPIYHNWGSWQFHPTSDQTLVRICRHCGQMQAKQAQTLQYRTNRP